MLVSLAMPALLVTIVTKFLAMATTDIYYVSLSATKTVFRILCHVINRKRLPFSELKHFLFYVVSYTPITLTLAYTTADAVFLRAFLAM